MTDFNTFVWPKQIWPNAKNYEYKGQREGLVCGWNIEVLDIDGKPFWLSTEYVHLAPNKAFNDDFHTWRCQDNCWKPTGRICFRGYGKEQFDYVDRETYIIPCDENGKELVTNV